jgi:hypothetical protein
MLSLLIRPAPIRHTNGTGWQAVKAVCDPVANFKLGEATMKFLSIYMPDPKAAGVPPSEEHMAEMGKLAEESIKASTLISTGMFVPDSDGGTRVRRSGGEIVVAAKLGALKQAADGKSGFAVLEAGSREEAIELARNFLNVDGECELCQIQAMEPGGSCGQAQ